MRFSTAANKAVRGGLGRRLGKHQLTNELSCNNVTTPFHMSNLFSSLSGSELSCWAEGGVPTHQPDPGPAREGAG